MGIVPSK